MFTVKLDQSRNALTISYGGQVTPDETRVCAEEVRLALAILEPGFRLIVDLIELQSMAVACSPVLANIMEICNAAGVAEVVRRARFTDPYGCNSLAGRGVRSGISPVGNFQGRCSLNGSASSLPTVNSSSSRNAATPMVISACGTSRRRLR